MTPELKETHKRWIQALLDHGFIEPHEYGTRKFKKIRADNEMAQYLIRHEFYEFFSGAETVRWAVQHDSALKAKMAARGMKISRTEVTM